MTEPDFGSEDDLPGMWEFADFLGGDPDERSYAQREADAQSANANRRDSGGNEGPAMTEPVFVVGSEVLLTRAECAARAGMKVGTWAGYVNRGRAPEPDLRIGGRPLWKESTVVRWMANRPGQGRRTDLARL